MNKIQKTISQPGFMAGYVTATAWAITVITAKNFINKRRAVA